ncbi:hypothetical protein IEZ26_03850 [Nocardioides cavernae]|uniref:Uncharacterized protein n=1 Tax=Nocardioides cavernae TaxID=1921566 RepID=A0ABR8N6I6_9ACTN|nr:hypothetical protein [Nocardioides cavernae]MBD3923743.1 hypothetical protein [Nocardioides cavernae]MBM7511324.1 hypothetical protein [Nocardioides cavernae]
MRRPKRPALHLIVLGVGLATASVLWTYYARQLWFFMDDWTYIIWRGVFGGQVGLMEPHNEHWVALPTLVLRAMFNVVGLQHYLPWAMLAVLLHLITSLLVYALVRRAGAGPWPSVVTALALAFLGAGAENPLWASQIGSIGAHTLTLAALVVLLGEEAQTLSRRALASFLLTLSLTTMGLSLVLVGWIALVLALVRGVREVVMVVSAPVVVYLTWYVVWGSDATAPASATWAQAWDFAWVGLAAIWDKGLGLPGLGLMVLACLLLVSLADQKAPYVLRTLAWSGLLVVAAAFVLIGHSRGQYGPQFGAASRYVYFGVVLTLPAVACALEVLSRQFTRRMLEATAALAAVIGILIVNGTLAMDRYTVQRSADTLGLEQRLVAAVDLLDSGAPTLSASLDSRWATDMHKDRIVDDDIRAALPRIPVTDQGRLDAAAHLQVALVSEPIDAPSPTKASLTQVSGPARLAPCSAAPMPNRVVPVGGWIDLPASSKGGQVGLIAAGGYEIQTTLFRGGLQSDTNFLVLPANTLSYVASVAPDASMRVLVPAGSLIGLCTAGR